MDKINLREKFSLFNEQWKPKIVGELNGQQVKLVKFQGPFTWHHHDHEDELFLVVKGGSAWSSVTARFGSKRVNSSSFLLVVPSPCGSPRHEPGWSCPGNGRLGHQFPTRRISPVRPQ